MFNFVMKSDFSCKGMLWSVLNLVESSHTSFIGMVWLDLQDSLSVMLSTASQWPQFQIAGLAEGGTNETLLKAEIPECSDNSDSDNTSQRVNTPYPGLPDQNIPRNDTSNTNNWVYDSLGLNDIQILG